MKRAVFLFFLFSVFLTVMVVCAITPLQLLQSIPLAHVEGRIDHLAVDVKGQRLFLSALGNGTVEVLDLHAGQVTQTIRGLHEPQGILFVPGLNRLFVAGAGDGTCRVFNGSTFEQIQSIALTSDADNIRYDPARREVYVGYGNGALAIIDAANNLRLGDIRLPAHPESFQLEQAGTRIFVNVPEADALLVVDRERRVVTTKWSLDGAHSNFPMALDEADHRLFVACRRPAKLLVYDTDSGKIVASAPVVGDCDDLFFDAVHHRIYATGGGGTVSVVTQEDKNHYRVTANLPTAPGARTSLFVPEWGRLYVAIPLRGHQSSEVRVYEAR